MISLTVFSPGCEYLAVRIWARWFSLDPLMSDAATDMYRRALFLLDD